MSKDRFDKMADPYLELTKNAPPPPDTEGYRKMLRFKTLLRIVLEEGKPKEAAIGQLGRGQGVSPKRMRKELNAAIKERRARRSGGDGK